MAQWLFLSPGTPGVAGDFSSFWSAGRLALEGHPGQAYQEAPHHAVQIALYGDPHRPYLTFMYPPFFLLLCLPFAMMAFVPAVALWLVATGAAYASAIRAVLPQRGYLVLFLGYPAVLINAGYGQNGFLSAALLGWATSTLGRWPVLAGVSFGCLAYKPQLGVIVPLALAVAGRWRCFVAAAATVLALAAAVTVVFGPDIWLAFFAANGQMRFWLQSDDVNYLDTWITLFGTLRLHGASLPVAYAAQAVVTLVSAALLLATLRRRPGGLAEGAAITACVPFCSPFMLEYDLVILAVPMAWMLSEGLRGGFLRGERAVLLAAYFAPVVFKITLLDDFLKPFTIIAAAALFVAVLRRIRAKEGQGSAPMAPWDPPGNSFPGPI